MAGLICTVHPGAEGVRAAVERVRAVLDGTDSVALVHTTGGEGIGDELPAQPSIILATSGSTGVARGVEIDRDALLASATLADEVLGGPGLWLTAIPVTGAGGMNTLVRSLRHGHAPVVWEGVAGAGHFDGASVLPALRELRQRADAAGLRAYTALVPTQVARLLSFAGADDRDSVEALHELARLDAVLIGADALSDEHRLALRGYGVHFVTTYGATETCGGCIYDDRPFPGTTVSFEGEDPGRIVITGPTVAHRYRDDDPDLADRRWRSNDLGRWRLGRLEVVGRLDEVVKVGGANVALPLIAAAIRTLADVTEVAVLSRPDSEWGHVPVAFVVGGTTPDASLRQFAASALGRGSMPLDIVRLEHLPLLPNGKPDRQRLLGMVR